MDIELRHLRAFVAVAEELNFTRAAKRLFIAQHALSAQIRQLEDRIGTKLLERTTRSVSLTEAGEVLSAQARLLLADADTVVAATRAAGATRTPLTVGFVAAVNHPEMSHALDRFSQAHPEVELMINFGDQLDPTGGLHGSSAPSRASSSRSERGSASTSQPRASSPRPARGSSGADSTTCRHCSISSPDGPTTTGPWFGRSSNRLPRRSVSEDDA